MYILSLRKTCHFVKDCSITVILDNFVFSAKGSRKMALFGPLVDKFQKMKLKFDGL